MFCDINSDVPVISVERIIFVELILKVAKVGEENVGVDLLWILSVPNKSRRRRIFLLCQNFETLNFDLDFLLKRRIVQNLSGDSF